MAEYSLYVKIICNRSAVKSRCIESSYRNLSSLKKILGVHYLLLMGYYRALGTSTFKVYLSLIRSILLIRHIPFSNIVTYVCYVYYFTTPRIYICRFVAYVQLTRNNKLWSRIKDLKLTSRPIFQQNIIAAQNTINNIP